jgi:hypothetical protein
MIGSIQPPHSTLTPGTLEGAKMGKIKQHDPQQLRVELGVTRPSDERVFEPLCWPQEITDAVISMSMDKDRTHRLMNNSTVPLRPEWVSVMKRPEHKNKFLFCVPNLSIHSICKFCSHMFGDISGIGGEDKPLTAGQRDPVLDWWVVSGNTLPSSSGNLFLPKTVMAHIVHRHKTGRNLFQAEHLVSSNHNGRLVVIVINPKDGKISIPRLDYHPAGGDSHVHGVFLPS